MRKAPRFLVNQDFENAIRDNERFRIIDIGLWKEAGFTEEEISNLLVVSQSEVRRCIRKVKNLVGKGSVKDLLTNLK